MYFHVVLAVVVVGTVVVRTVVVMGRVWGASVVGTVFCCEVVAAGNSSVDAPNSEVPNVVDAVCCCVLVACS